MLMQKQYNEHKETFKELRKIHSYLQTKGVRLSEAMEHFNDSNEEEVVGYLEGAEDSEHDYEVTIRKVLKDTTAVKIKDIKTNGKNAVQ